MLFSEIYLEVNFLRSHSGAIGIIDASFIRFAQVISHFSVLAKKTITRFSLIVKNICSNLI